MENLLPRRTSLGGGSGALASSKAFEDWASKGMNQ